MRSLEEVLAELKAAEKEYAEKCQKYGIEEKHKKKKNLEVLTDETQVEGEQVENQDNPEQTNQETIQEEANN